MPQTLLLTATNDNGPFLSRFESQSLPGSTEFTPQQLSQLVALAEAETGQTLGHPVSPEDILLSTVVRFFRFIFFLKYVLFFPSLHLCAVIITFPTTTD
jgi:hypothetical protein